MMTIWSDRDDPMDHVVFLDELFRGRSQTVVRGAWCKKFFDPCKVGPWKNYHRFSIRNWVYMFFYGLTRNFHGKKGGPEFVCSLNLGAQKIFAITNFCIRPPLQVFVNGPLNYIFWHSTSIVESCCLHHVRGPLALWELLFSWFVAYSRAAV